MLIEAQHHAAEVRRYRHDLADPHVLERQAIGLDMGVPGDAVFVILADVDHFEQHDVAQHADHVARAKLRTGGKPAAGLQRAPIGSAGAHNSVVEIVEGYDVDG